MKETKNNSWLCEIQAPPELHESIEQFFNALSYKLRHADGWQAGYECGYEKAMAEMRGEKDGDVIYRRQAIHAFDNAGFCTHDYLFGVLKDLPSAKSERKKGKWLVDEDGNMECPFCGNTCGFGNYCNECGADLRGE